MKDGRTHLAHKAEHAVDGDRRGCGGCKTEGDTTTSRETLIDAAVSCPMGWSRRGRRGQGLSRNQALVDVTSWSVYRNRRRISKRLVANEANDWRV